MNSNSTVKDLFGEIEGVVGSKAWKIKLNRKPWNPSISSTLDTLAIPCRSKIDVTSPKKETPGTNSTSVSKNALKVRIMEQELQIKQLENVASINRRTIRLLDMRVAKMRQSRKR
jgi:hypothetical protein